MLKNVTPDIQNGTGQAIQFDVQLVVDDNSVSMAAAIDDKGLTLTTKKDNVHLPRSIWLDVAVVNNSLVLIVAGFGYDQWSKKRKFESKNPGVEFTDFEVKPSTYVLKFKPAKLPQGITLVDLNRQAKRTYTLAYLDEVENPTIVQCPDCNSMMDVTPYQDSHSLFCDNCSRVIGVPDEPDYGICDRCQYYTQLVEQKKATGESGPITVSRVCHPCRVRQTFVAFATALGIAIAIGLLNVATLFFANRFFPILILFAGVSFLWSLFNLLKVIIYSAAQKATGGSPLANATKALKNGNTEKALEIISSMDRDMTDNPGILMNLCRGLMNSGDFAKADQFADTLIANFPNFQFGYMEKMQTRAALNANQDELRERMQEAIEVGARNHVRSPAKALMLSQMS